MTKPFSKRPRFALIVLAMITLLAVAFAFPQVRVIAGQFLGLFRVEKVALVPFDPENVSLARADNQMSALFADNYKYETIGERQEVASAEEAAAIAGIPVRLPNDPTLGEPRLYLEAGTHGEFNVDLPRIRTILQEAGYTDIVLPENLDQVLVTVDIPQPVIAEYGECRPATGNDPNDPDDTAYRSGPPRCVTLMQLASPTISAPPDLNIQEIGQAFLQLTGMPSHDAEAFSKNVDWATTLVLPIPASADYSEVEVDGVQGFVLKQQYNTSYYTLFWAKDGKLYILASTYGGSYLGRAIADTLE